MQSAMGGRTSRHRQIDVAQILKSRAKCLPGARRPYKCVCGGVGFFFFFISSHQLHSVMQMLLVGGGREAENQYVSVSHMICHEF
jgi:hypothetical protein